MFHSIVLVFSLASLAAGFVPSAPHPAFLSHTSLRMAEKVGVTDIVDTAVAAGSFKTFKLCMFSMRSLRVVKLSIDFFTLSNYCILYDANLYRLELLRM